MPTIKEIDDAFRDQACLKALAPVLGKTAAERDNARNYVKSVENAISELRREISTGASMDRVSERLGAINNYLTEKIAKF